MAGTSHCPINLPTQPHRAHVSDRRSQSTTCRILFRQAWRTFHLHRPIDSGSSPADFHTGRTCPHENAHLPVVYHYRSRIMDTILAVIGYYLSTVPGIESEEQLIAKVTEYSHEIGYCFIAIGIFIVGFLVYKGMKK